MGEMKALYRKYRPTKLSEVIGQERVTKPLENSLKTGNISHAYLFTGPRGCGKTSVARILAHEVNGFDYKIEDNYTDIIEIDAASNTGVDNIRDLIEKTIIAPTEGKYKVYIIDEVHMLSKSAFNALLKTLEEPPKHVIFIMATTDAYKVPITITSRSQVYNFQLATPDVMLNHLKTIAKKEKININDDALEQIVIRGGGSFRDSISLLDQISTLSDKDITKEDVLSALGIPDEQIINQLLEAYENGDFSTITDILHTTLDSGLKAEILAENIIRNIISNPKPKFLPLLQRLPEVKDSFPEAKLLVTFLAEAAERPQFATLPTKVAHTAPPEPKPVVMPPKEPAKKTSVPVDFSWEDYLSSVHDASPTIFSILEKCTYQYSGNILTIYPAVSIQKKILEAAKNKAILAKNLPSGISLEITDGKNRPKNTDKSAKNPELSKISDIMGEIQEVKTDGVPF